MQKQSNIRILEILKYLYLRTDEEHPVTVADILDYSRMYNMDLQKVLQARLFVNGNYVALLILGAQGDWEASDEVQAKFAAEEAAKVDEVWRGIFGSADNGITIPEEDDSNNNGGFFDMTDDEGNNDPVLGG